MPVIIECTFEDGTTEIERSARRNVAEERT